MLTFIEAVEKALALKASDLFIVAGQPLTCRVGKHLVNLAEEKLLPDGTRSLVMEAYALADRSADELLAAGDDDFAISVPGLSRLRMNAYKQRGSLSAVVRLISFGIPDYRTLSIPENVMDTAHLHDGLVIVSGVAGSGKSTTLACILDRINHSRSGHIVTLEDPIEFLHRNDQCIVSQREIGIDTADYMTGLRSSLRQAPDVILLGEMRDYDTIRTAMTAAETGHLVLSTLHTRGAASTVDRIIDIFPPNQQQQIRVQLSTVLRTVISQQLITGKDGELIPVFEVMHNTNPIRNLIRDAKLHQIDSVIATSAADGMVSMDSRLMELFTAGKITAETAIDAAVNPDLMQKRLK